MGMPEVAKGRSTDGRQEIEWPCPVCGKMLQRDYQPGDGRMSFGEFSGHVESCKIAKWASGWMCCCGQRFEDRVFLLGHFADCSGGSVEAHITLAALQEM